MTKKARFEIRIDPDTHSALKDLSDQIGVSMNQVIEGILVWAAERSHAGYPSPINSQASAIDTDPGPAVWFGESGFDDEGREVGDARFDFLLDFAPGRSVVARLEDLGS